MCSKLCVSCFHKQRFIINSLYILQMVLQLNDIAAHFVEDFMLCGSQQLLSLQHLTSETMTFQLTDLAAHCVTNANQVTVQTNMNFSQFIKKF